MQNHQRDLGSKYKLRKGPVLWSAQSVLLRTWENPVHILALLAFKFGTDEVILMWKIDVKDIFFPLFHASVAWISVSFLAHFNNVKKLHEHPLNHCVDYGIDFSFQQYKYKSSHKIEMKYSYSRVLPLMYMHGFIMR